MRRLAKNPAEAEVIHILRKKKEKLETRNKITIRDFITKKSVEM